MPAQTKALQIALPLLALMAAPLASGSAAHHHAASVGPASHAPIGVMGDHRHKAGEWMLSYRVMDMRMEGLMQGSSQVSAGDVTGTMMMPGNYMVAPTRMDMEMQMLGAMYAPSDDLTLMLMTSYKRNEMDHVTRMGMRFTTRSEGLGDTKVGGLIRLFEADDHSHTLHLNAGLSLPTGSIDEKDDTPSMADAKLPYGMQLGSGSLDLLPGITWQAYQGAYNWGAQLSAVLPMERNDNDYRLGNSAALTVWLARKATDFLSYSLRLTGESQGKIDGERDDLNPMMVTTADTDNYGGDRLSLSYGLNAYIPDGALRGHRFALEYTLPLHQDLNGVQLEREPYFTAGWQLAF
ncbi:hypothetical protein FHR99_002141 [Litorivivens lipolytica]|uniref:MetA-pathway of phenol degradation n=1 Tax=Litorivivens lipolytica TaxID=1524264 RepID=A0A7W4W5M5_9GAMM|nr:transporter [Litorivivens lipolytica]MBB3047875.1 hypothetical protein [Litorivivens lipolytica]